MRFITKDRKTLLYVLAAASPIAFAVWQTLLNNYVIEVVHFTGKEIGFLQSIREVPGFLAFTVLWVLLIVRQQNLAIVSLILLGLGTAATGVFSSVIGLYITTVLMSIGFHFLETMQTSLSLQWLAKNETAKVLGKIISVRSIATLTVLGSLYLGLQFFQPNYTWIYAFGGGAAVCIGIYCWAAFPHFKDDVVQRKELFLRRRYWLFYVLTFLAGARRQIFTVFAGFLLVQKFGFPLEKMVLLILINSAINIWLAPRIGALIGFIGERRALTLEYVGLIIIFLSYAMVENGNLAIALYILDHIFFSMAIAINTYFQKIADPADIAATSGISFTINHIAAVVLPAALGLIWIINHSAVFVVGALIALGSLTLVQLIPDAPSVGKETRWPAKGAVQPA
ncbi:MAG: MFS transporter [Gammaproteobacteria bacterium]|nr:MFS transporter [Gammaproteobacteria bacterium]